MNKNLKKKAASIAVSFVMAGSAGAAMGSTVFAEDTNENITEIEQELDEGKEEVKEVQEVKEAPKEEVKEEVVEEQPEVEEEANEEANKEVKEEPKAEEQKEEVKEEVKAESNNEEENEMVQVTRTVVPATADNPASEIHKVPVITTKVDENGKPLSGAVLQILDSEGNVVDEWVSDGSEHESMLPEGDYVLHEVSAPDGYKVAPDKAFTVKVEVNDLDAGVDFSETPCNHYGGTPLYYVESGGEKQEVYCINQDWETPDDNSVYDGKVITPTDIKTYTTQTVYIDPQGNKEKVDISDPSLNSEQLYNKILDVVYHRQLATELFPDLTEAEIRYVTESALKNYTNAGLTRIQGGIRNVNNIPEGAEYWYNEEKGYYEYLYTHFRSFVYNPDAPLGQDVYTISVGNGDAFGTLARHWSSAHGGKNNPESRAKLARYYELYQYLTSDLDRHPDDMHLYIFYTDNMAEDLSGYDFDGGAYQNLLGIRWFDPYDENYKVYLVDVNEAFTNPPIEPEEPEKPLTPIEPEKTPATVYENSPQTGDESADLLPFALAGLALSTAGAGAAVRVRRRYQ